MIMIICLNMLFK